MVEKRVYHPCKLLFAAEVQLRPNYAYSTTLERILAADPGPFATLQCSLKSSMYISFKIDKKRLFIDTTMVAKIIES